MNSPSFAAVAKGRRSPLAVSFLPRLSRRCFAAVPALLPESLTVSFEVMSEPCDQCLMTKNKIVSDARRKQILADTRRRDCFFVCHKATIVGREIACRGHFDATSGGQLARIAGRLGMIEFVDPKSLATSDA